MNSTFYETMRLQMLHANGKFPDVLVLPKPKSQFELRAEAAMWEHLIIERYRVEHEGRRRDSRAWLIRIRLIKALAEDNHNKVHHGLTCLSVCNSSFDMYQHYAFLIRVAERFDRDHWVKLFKQRQRVLS